VDDLIRLRTRDPGLGQAVTFISDALADPVARVYVHCRGGVERTATILVAWYARQHGTDYDSALEELRLHRPACRPNERQEAMTKVWLGKPDPAK
jgi:protein-tyrosine phosphatase